MHLFSFFILKVLFLSVLFLSTTTFLIGCTPDNKPSTAKAPPNTQPESTIANSDSPTTQNPSASKKTEQRPAPASVGALIFHDTTLSNPQGQSCATCHQAQHAFADNVVVNEGAVKGAFGKRNTPSLTYAAFIPVFSGSYLEDWRGGQFWDGRVDTLEEQALEPFFDPLEMNSSPSQLAAALRQASYADQLKAFYGEDVIKSDERLVAAAAEAVAQFQRTELFAPFDSKFDYRQAGLVEFTEQEIRGEKVFNRSGFCIDCHAGRADEKELFTGFVYHNIAVPANPLLPFYEQPKDVNPQGKNFVDIGLALNSKISNDEKEPTMGLFRTPTLRNVAITAPYMHNGVFSTLDEAIEFYVDMEKFWPAEVPSNRSGRVSSSLDLTSQDQQDLIAFLHTLTDGYAVSKELKDELRRLQQAAHKAYKEQEKEWLEE